MTGRWKAGGTLLAALLAVVVLAVVVVVVAAIWLDSYTSDEATGDEVVRAEQSLLDKPSLEDAAERSRGAVDDGAAALRRRFDVSMLTVEAERVQRCGEFDLKASRARIIDSVTYRAQNPVPEKAWGEAVTTVRDTLAPRGFRESFRRDTGYRQASFTDGDAVAVRLEFSDGIVTLFGVTPCLLPAAAR